MLKLLGVVLILGGTTWVGLSETRGLNHRVHALRGWVNALGRMEQELTFHQLSMPALLAKLAQEESALTAFFISCHRDMAGLEHQNFDQLWQKNICGLAPPIGEEGVEILIQLGGVLGRFDAQYQGAVLGQSARRLTQLALVAQEERQRLGKVYTTLGVAVGCLFVLAFL